MPLRILQVTPSVGFGGAEYSLLFASQELVRRGHVVEVCALHGPLELREDFTRSGIRVHCLNYNHPIQFPVALAELCRLIRSGGFHIVRSLMAEASMMTALTRPFAANPLRVASYHHVDFDIHPADRLRRRVRKAVYAGLMRNAVDAHVGISRAVARHYERHLGLKKVEVISNGFPVSQLQKYLCPDPLAVRRALGITEQFVAVCPARFSSEKGHEYLLEAIAILRKEKHSICLLLYGRGMLEQKLRVDCAVLGIADVVRFMGVVAQEELMPALAASDALVLPSPQGEGFGRVLAEAMVLGIPVITPGVGGALDFVDHRGNGLLVEPASPAAIAGALRELILDTGLRQDLGRAARKRVEGDFDIRICGDRWEELFARLMSTRHG